MGRIRVIARLVARDLRRRRGEAVLMLITMRDGVLVDETRLTGGRARSLGAITGLEE